MRNIAIFCLFSFYLAQANAADRQAFSIYDNQVTFDVPADWVVIQKDSNANVDVVVFQVKNPADEGTPDSANVAVLVYKDKGLTVEDIAASSMNRIKGYPGGAVLSRTDGDKKNSDVFMQSTFHQAKTGYTAFDRMARRGNALVSIGAAWPLLERTTQEWTDKFISDVNSLFSDLKIDGVPISKTTTIKVNEESKP